MIQLWSELACNGKRRLRFSVAGVRRKASRLRLRRGVIPSVIMTFANGQTYKRHSNKIICVNIFKT